MVKAPIPKIYGVLGYPAKHSFSPAMHNAAFRALKINAKYGSFEVKPGALEDFLKELEKKNIFGLNITIPYKEKMLEYVEIDKSSFGVREIRAVNTIRRESDGKLKGFNTDWAGFGRHLAELKIDLKGKSIALIGAGGAARALAYTLANSKVQDISIYDIDKTKSQNVTFLIQNLFPGFDIRPVENIEQLNIKGKDLLINAAPIGMKDADPCLVKEEMLHKDLFVYDLIYNPPETKLLTLAKNFGVRWSNGLGMLLYQGMLSFKIWTGQDAPQEVMWQALQGELNARNSN